MRFAHRPGADGSESAMIEEGERATGEGDVHAIARESYLSTDTHESLLPVIHLSDLKFLAEFCTYWKSEIY